MAALALAWAATAAHSPAAAAPGAADPVGVWTAVGGSIIISITTWFLDAFIGVER
ncbi:hypothetical protein [Nocardioides sp. YIM 152588]|uniref:hypothetical protein n=1 Tax=Nocardioides sp. YIM 152588 TaxID=3158259 RepID=UPI0032E4236C